MVLPREDGRRRRPPTGRALRPLRKCSRVGRRQGGLADGYGALGPRGRTKAPSDKLTRELVGAGPSLTDRHRSPSSGQQPAPGHLPPRNGEGQSSGRHRSAAAGLMPADPGALRDTIVVRGQHPAVSDTRNDCPPRCRARGSPWHEAGLAPPGSPPGLVFVSAAVPAPYYAQAFSPLPDRCFGMVAPQGEAPQSRGVTSRRRYLTAWKALPRCRGHRRSP
jgi:hypothetical protein